MHSYRMSAMQEAYDGLGDETFDLLMALHLEDAITAKPQDMNGEPASLGIPMDIQIFVQELAQYQEDRRSHGRNPPPTNKGAENACLKQKKFECLVCGDQVQANEAWTAPCSHHYCIDCLENFHRACLADQTLYPPKCCHLEMPWSDVKPRINHQLARTFEGKREELNTDAGRRTYCFYPPCARFIGPSDIKGDLATCPTCRNVTCTMCKAASHGGDCPADETLRQTLQLASEQGWKRCNNCRSIVELTRGCNHITCTCRHEFCYTCLATWRTCSCVMWTEQRLLAGDGDDHRAAVVAPRPRAPRHEEPGGFWNAQQVLAYNGGNRQANIVPPRPRAPQGEEPDGFWDAQRVLAYNGGNRRANIVAPRPRAPRHEELGELWDAQRVLAYNGGVHRAAVEVPRPRAPRFEEPGGTIPRLIVSTINFLVAASEESGEVMLRLFAQTREFLATAREEPGEVMQRLLLETGRILAILMPMPWLLLILSMSLLSLATVVIKGPILAK